MIRFRHRPLHPSCAIPRRGRILLCVAAAWLAPAGLHAQAAPAPAPPAARAEADAAASARSAPLSAPMPMDPAVRTGTLANGLRYWIRANAEPADRAELRLVVNAGSVLEDSTQRGLAHLVEHMAFNGTRRFPRQKIVSYLESVGMRFGPDVNAYTSFDETVYMLTLPTDTASVMETGLDILVDW
ncbi:MAG TPA: insulinase family protein, partial [Gemmatimonadaceae bacterium]|nr:insulinase family protein [Gemmatimonadaceae bacterium]